MDRAVAGGGAVLPARTARPARLLVHLSHSPTGRRPPGPDARFVSATTATRGAHAYEHGGDLARPGQRRALGWALGVNVALLVAEVVGGIVFASLALLADAAPLVSDVAGLAVEDESSRATRRWRPHHEARRAVEDLAGRGAVRDGDLKGYLGERAAGTTVAAVEGRDSGAVVGDPERAGG